MHKYNIECHHTPLLRTSQLLPYCSQGQFSENVLFTFEEGIKKKVIALRAGFEPARGDPIGFQVQRLNHSAITAVDSQLLTAD